MHVVFESLIKARNAEQHPRRVYVIGVVYAVIGLFFDITVFEGRLPNLFIFIVVFASIPLMHKIILLEEKKDRVMSKEVGLLKEHERAIVALVMLFLGMLTGFTAGYVFLPEETVDQVFLYQRQDIHSVQNAISGRLAVSGPFASIFANNLRVLSFSFIFSFFFGAGAIFILAWNAALLATALGSFIRAALATSPGFAYSVGTVSYAFFGYLSHSIFEISSYFIAGLAGGIISVAVIKHDLFHRHFRRIVGDALWMMGIAVLLLLVGGIVEAYFSPLLFP